MAEDTSGKAAWQKPENWFTWGGLAILGYVVFTGLDNILPLVNRVMELIVETTLNTALAAGVVGVVGWLIFSKDLHQLGWYAYKQAMRWVTRRFVEIDPIAIMKTYVSSLKDNLKEISKALGSLRTQAKSLESAIEVSTKGIETSMNLAAEAQKRVQGGTATMRQQVVLQSRKAGRLEQSTVTYQGLLNKLKTHIAVTEKIREAATFMIADIEDTVEEETRKRDMIQASYKAMSASRRILASDKQRELYDMAMESLTQDYFSKLGEIQQFMEDSQSFVDSMDLTNGVYEADALAKLEAWGKRSEALLEGGSGATKYRIAPVGSSASGAANDSEEEPENEKRQSYADLFGKL